MKNTYILLLSILFSAVSYSQSIEPVESTIKQNDSERPCLVVTLDPTEGELEDAWEDFLKSKYNLKLGSAGFLGIGHLYEAKEVIVPAISSKTMDFYSNIEAKEGGTELKVFAAFGYDLYVSPTETPDAFAGMERMLKEFIATYLPGYYQEKIEADQKRLDKLTKTEGKQAKKLEKNRDKVEKLTEEIAEVTEAHNETVEAKKKLAVSWLIENYD